MTKKTNTPVTEVVKDEKTTQKKPLNICGHRKTFYIISIALIVISIIVALCGRLNLAIQFKGGT